MEARYKAISKTARRIALEGASRTRKGGRRSPTTSLDRFRARREGRDPRQFERRCSNTRARLEQASARPWKNREPQPLAAQRSSKAVKATSSTDGRVSHLDAVRLNNEFRPITGGADPDRRSGARRGRAQAESLRGAPLRRRARPGQRRRDDAYELDGSPGAAPRGPAPRGPRGVRQMETERLADSCRRRRANARRNWRRGPSRPTTQILDRLEILDESYGSSARTSSGSATRSRST